MASCPLWSRPYLVSLLTWISGRSRLVTLMSPRVLDVRELLEVRDALALNSSIFYPWKLSSHPIAQNAHFQPPTHLRGQSCFRWSCGYSRIYINLAKLFWLYILNWRFFFWNEIFEKSNLELNILFTVVCIYAITWRIIKWGRGQFRD